MWHFETKQLHAGQERPDPATGARAVPIYQSTSFVFDNCDDAAARFALTAPGHIYSRITNPTEAVFEERMAALEGGSAALALASGAAAVTYTIMNLAGAGDHIVSANSLYGGTFNLFAATLPRYGITTDFVDPAGGTAAFEAAIRPNTKGIFVETLGNPNSNVADIAALAALAHRHAIPLVVDNTFATPYLLRPLEHGADIVVHSATKFIGGHGTTLGGVIVDGGFDWEKSGKFPHLTEPNESYHGVSFSKACGAAAFVTAIRVLLLRDTGAAISPFSAFLLLQGTETLSLRVERHVQNALRVVDWLQSHPKAAAVRHPSLPGDPTHAAYQKYFPQGAGSIFTFDVAADERGTRDFIDRLKLFSNLANVADQKSLVIHPASTTHSQLNEQQLREQGIYKNSVRLSIGTEHIDDILADLDQALAGV